MSIAPFLNLPLYVAERVFRGNEFHRVFAQLNKACNAKSKEVLACHYAENRKLKTYLHRAFFSNKLRKYASTENLKMLNAVNPAVTDIIVGFINKSFVDISTLRYKLLLAVPMNRLVRLLKNKNVSRDRIQGYVMFLLQHFDSRHITWLIKGSKNPRFIRNIEWVFYKDIHETDPAYANGKFLASMEFGMRYQAIWLREYFSQDLIHQRAIYLVKHAPISDVKWTFIYLELKIRDPYIAFAIDYTKKVDNDKIRTARRNRRPPRLPRPPCMLK